MHSNIVNLKNNNNNNNISLTIFAVGLGLLAVQELWQTTLDRLQNALK